MVPCPAVPSPGLRPTVLGLSRVQAAAVGALLALVGLLVGQGRVSYAQTSDPFGTLLVSQALARHGTIHLEVLGVPDLEARLAYRGFVRNGHTYYVYPLGTALVATPFVALADALGVDLARHEAEVRLQHWLATLAAVVLVALLLRPGPSSPAVLAGADLHGRLLGRHVFVEHWRHRALVAHRRRHRVGARHRPSWSRAELARRPVAWLPLGGLLFLGYLTRPTAALFAGLLLVWIGRRDLTWRRQGGVCRRPCRWPGSWRSAGTSSANCCRRTTASGSREARSPPRRSRACSSVPRAACCCSRRCCWWRWAARPLARRDVAARAAAWWLVGLAWPVLLVARALTLDDVVGRWLLRPAPADRRAAGTVPAHAADMARAPAERRGVDARRGARVCAGGLDVRARRPGPLQPVDVAVERTALGGHRAVGAMDVAVPAVPARGGAAPRPPGRLLRAPASGAAATTPVAAGETLEPIPPHFDALGFDRMRPTGRWTLLPVAELLFTPAAGSSDAIGTSSSRTGPMDGRRCGSS